MAQVKVLAAKPDNLNLIPQDPHGGRKEPAPKSYPLTSTWPMCMNARTHTHTLTLIDNDVF